MSVLTNDLKGIVIRYSIIVGGNYNILEVTFPLNFVKPTNFPVGNITGERSSATFHALKMVWIERGAEFKQV